MHTSFDMTIPYTPSYWKLFISTALYTKQPLAITIKEAYQHEILCSYST
jgi:hypothetical protein